MLNRISEQNSSRSCPVAFRTDNHLGDYRKPGGNQGLGLVVPTRGGPKSYFAAEGEREKDWNKEAGDLLPGAPLAKALAKLGHAPPV